MGLLTRLLNALRALIRFIQQLFGSPGSSPPATPVNTLPTVNILAPLRDVVDSVVEFRFELIDLDSDPVDVLVEYVVAGSTAVSASPLVSDPRHSGTVALQTSPAGIGHVFVWDWTADLGPGPVADVVIRITPSDSRGAGVVQSTPLISIQTAVMSPSPTPTPTTQNPVVTVTAPTGPVTANNVAVEFTISHPTSDPVNIDVLYSVAGGLQRSATAVLGDPRHSGITALPTSAAGNNFTFVWDWSGDTGLSAVTDVTIEITAITSSGGSNTAQSIVFDVALPVLTPVPANVPPRVVVFAQPPTVATNQPILINYELIDPDADTASVEAHFTVAGGNLAPASQAATDPRHSGTTNLAMSAAGERHGFVWDWAADVGVSGASQVSVQLIAQDQHGLSAPATTPSFDIVIPAPTPAPSARPSTNVLAPVGVDWIGTVIAVEYTIIDPDSQTADFELQYSAGGAWLVATPDTSDPQHSGVSGLATSGAGVAHTFVWDWQSDLGTGLVTGVDLRLLASDAVGAGQPRIIQGISLASAAPAPTPGIGAQPGVTIISPASDFDYQPSVVVELMMFDDSNEPVDLALELLQPGGNWQAATAVTSDPAHDGTQGLSTSSQGDTHQFVWDLDVDLGSAPVDNVLLRAFVTNSNGTSPVDLSRAFSVNAPAIAQPPAPALTVTLDSQGGPLVGEEVAVDYTLVGDANDPVAITVEYSVAGGAFATATAMAGHAMHNGITNLAAGTTGQVYTFVWDWMQDIAGAAVTDVTLKVTAVAASGVQAVAQAANINVSVQVPKYEMNLTTSGSTVATPGLAVPNGSFVATLTNHGQAVANSEVVIHVLEGGGGFFESRPPAPDQLASSVTARTNSIGEVQVPEFILGKEPGINRLLVQSAHAEMAIGIEGSFQNTRLEPINPASGTEEWVATGGIHLVAQLQDSGYPGAKIEGVSVDAEIINGGGWIGLAEGRGMADRFVTGDVAVPGTTTWLHSGVSVLYFFSSLEESSQVRLSLSEFSGPEFTFTLDSRKMRLFSYRVGQLTSENLDRVSAGWLSRMVRLGVTDDPAVAVSGPLLTNLRTWGTYEIVAERLPTPILSELHPSHRAGYWGTPSLMTRPISPGPFGWRLYLPDFADSNDYEIQGVAESRLQGSDVRFSSPPWYVQAENGGTFDDLNGVELLNPRGDVQFVGPGTNSVHPFELDVVTRTLQPVDERRLLGVAVYFKVRTSPNSSIIDDPNWVAPLNPGTVGLSPSGGVDELEVSVPATPGVHPISVYFHSHPDNTDNFIEVRVKVTITEKDANGVWHTFDRFSTLLSRAVFFAPRLSITKRVGSDYVVPGEEGLLPTPLFAADGTMLPPDPDREYFYELRTSASTPDTVEISQTGGGRVTLRKVDTTPIRTLYRSDPVVFYVESERSLGVFQFQFPSNRNFIKIRNPDWLYMDARRAVTPNPNDNSYYSPIRPFSFLTADPLGAQELEPQVPRPRLVFENLGETSGVYAVTMDNGAATLRLQGYVRDRVADITPGGVAQIPEVQINGTSYPIQSANEASSVLRPYAWRGNFTINVPLEPGLQTIELVVTNALGMSATQILEVVLLDSRNDFNNPDPAKMSVRVRKFVQTEYEDSKGLVTVTYRTPNSRQLASSPPSVGIVVESVQAHPSMSVDDTLNLNLTRSSGLENSYRQAVLAVPQGLDPALLTPLRNAGAPIISLAPGSRIKVSGQGLAHVAGPVDLHHYLPSTGLDLRILVKDDAGNFNLADRIEVGDEFTIEARDHDPWATNLVSMIVAVCDQFGRVGGPPHKALQIELTPSSGGWLRLSGVVDAASGNLIATDSIYMAGRNETTWHVAPLRANAHGMLRAGRLLGTKVGFSVPIVNSPKRQLVGNQPVPLEPQHGMGQRGGALNTVVAATGEIRIEEIDATLDGRSMNATFARKYRSFTQYEGPLGQGWNHSANSWVERVDPDTLRWVDAEAVARDFTFDAQSGEWQAPDGVFASVEVQGALLALTWPGGTKDYYVQQHPLIPVFLFVASIARTHNSTFVLTDQIGRSIRITNDLDTPLWIQYEDHDRIKSVSDPTGRLWRYRYHDASSALGPEGGLLSVRSPVISSPHNAFPNGRERHYDYAKDPGNALKHGKLIGLQDPEGAASRGGAGASLSPLISMILDNNGRVERQTYGRGDFVFTYNTNETIASDRRGNSTTYLFPSAPADPLLATLPTEVRLPGVSGQEVFTFEYNKHGMLTKHSGALGTVIEYVYDHQATNPCARGSLRTIKHFPRSGMSGTVLNTQGLTNFDQEPAETTVNHLECSWTYDDRYQQIRSFTDYLGNVKTFTFDYDINASPIKVGNPYELVEAPLTTGVHSNASGVRRTRYWYNNYGQVTKQANPLGVVTKFAYYPSDDQMGSLTSNLVSAVNEPTSRLAEVQTDETETGIARLSLLTAQERGSVRTTYDVWGNLRLVRNKLGNVTTLLHNEVGDLIERREADGGITRFWFDINGRPEKTLERVADIGLPVGAATNAARWITNTSAWNRQGSQTELVEDSGGSNLTTKFDYDEEDNQWKVHFPNANRAVNPDVACYAEYLYDAQNRVSGVIEAPGSNPQWTQTSSYDEEGNLEFTQVTHSGTTSGHITKQYVYDGFGRIARIVDNLDDFEEFKHDANGNVTFAATVGSVDGSSGAANKKALRAAFYFRNEGGAVVASQNKAYRWEQQGSGWRRRNIDSGVNVELSEYDATLQLLAQQDARGSRSELRYNGHGYLRGTASVNGQSNARYDLAGNLLEIDSPAPNGGNVVTSQRTYDAMNRLATSQEAGGGINRQYYNSRGQLRLFEDAVGNRTYYEYDGAGRTVSVKKEKYQFGHRVTSSGGTSPLIGNELTTATFDENGNVLNLKDWRGRQIISHTYGSRNERLSTTLPDDSFQVLQRPSSGPNLYKYGYWENGDIKHADSPDGWRITHSYDAVGRLTQLVVVQTPGVTQPAPLFGTTLQTFTYDGAGRCVASMDNNGSSALITTENHYDSQDNVWVDRQAETFTAARTDYSSGGVYFDEGRLGVVQHPGTGSANIRYVTDRQSRLDRIYNNNGPNTPLMTFQHNGGFLEKVQLDNNHTRAFDHDSNGNLQRLKHISTVAGDSPAATVPGLASGEKVVVADEIRMNSRMLPFVTKDLVENEASLTAHDSMGRVRLTMSGIDGDDLTSQAKYGVWHQYDSRGNAAVVEEGGIKNERGPNNELLIKNPSVFTREFNVAGQLGRSLETYVENGVMRNIDLRVHWDRRGNMKSDHRYQYRYDQLNRLVEVIDAQTNATVVTNRYDAFDRRILKNNDRFVYFRNKLIEERPGHGNWIQRYFYEGSGVFMIERESLPSGNKESYRVHRDQADSPMFLTDANGAIVEKYGFDPRTAAPLYFDEDGDPVTQPFGNSLLFQGMYYDIESQLYVVGSRCYHPHFRMMMQRDPEGFDLDCNPYAFLRGNSDAFIDPSGRWAVPLVVKVILVGAAIGAAYTVVLTTAEWLDGDRASPLPTLEEVGWGAAAGAALGLILFYRPDLGYTLAAVGGVEALKEASEGNVFKAIALGVGAFLGGRATKQTIAMRQRMVVRDMDLAISAIPDEAYIRPDVKIHEGGGGRLAVLSGGGRMSGDGVPTPQLKVHKGGGQGTPEFTVLHGGGQTARGTKGRGMAGSWAIYDKAGHLVGQQSGIQVSGGSKNPRGLGSHFEDNVVKNISDLVKPGDILVLRGPYDYCPQCLSGNVLGKMAVKEKIAIWYFSGEGTNRFWGPPGSKGGFVSAMVRTNGSWLWRHTRPDGVVQQRNYLRVREISPKTGRLVLAKVPGQNLHPGGNNGAWPYPRPDK